MTRWSEWEVEWQVFAFALTVCSGLLISVGVVFLVSEMDYQDELAEYEHAYDMIEPSCGEREP